ncbi:MAG: hypothetical protein SGPRY_005840 [Prymnesium sp.]
MPAPGVGEGLYIDSPVLSLTDKTLPSSADSPYATHFLLLQFYSEWCGHCQHFKPQYEALARAASHSIPSLLVAALNCPSYPEACANASVSSFPSFALFSRGRSHTYSGGASPDDILAWAMLHGRLSLPKRSEWLQMLDRVNSGASQIKSEWLWLLFHTLIEHSTETTALMTLDSIVGFVIHFFGCEECATHFAAMAATREYAIRTMTERGGRERAALWLWHAHNLVNLRLAKEPADEFIEFAKEEWPTKAECSSCHSVTLTHHAAKPIVGWDRKESLLSLGVLVAFFVLAFMCNVCGKGSRGKKKKKGDHIV